MLVRFTLNGAEQALDVPDHTLLVDMLRERLGLTGTHVGCDTSQCGACTLLVDGAGVKSCTMLAVQVDGRSVTTIEGLGAPDALHPMQAAFRDNHGLQCGFCTPGMVMAGIEIVRRRGHALDPDVVAKDLEGNICRCTGYLNIVSAIVDGAKRMGAA